MTRFYDLKEGVRRTDFSFHVQKRNEIMASTSSRPRGKLVTSHERPLFCKLIAILRRKEVGGPRFKINAVLKTKTNEATGHSYNVIRAVRQGELKTQMKNVNRKQIRFDKLDSFDLGVIRRIIHNRLYLKNESPTLKKILEILVEHMDFPYKRENLRLLLIKMGFKFTRRGGNSLIHKRQDLIAERVKFIT